MTTLHASDLDAASRSDLIARAEALGIDRADVLTRAELVDEIVKRTVADPIERRLARGLLGVARDLVARVVERGLHLPDAAALIRGLHQVTLTPVTPPIATVTLAEIYAGQGHRARALTVLDEVLAKEPEHAAARALREKIAAQPETTAPTTAPSEPPPIAEPSRASESARDPGPDHDPTTTTTTTATSTTTPRASATRCPPRRTFRRRSSRPTFLWPHGAPMHRTNSRPSQLERRKSRRRFTDTTRARSSLYASIPRVCSLVGSSARRRSTRRAHAQKAGSSSSASSL